MITLKFKGPSPDIIRDEVKRVLGLVEPHEAVEATPAAAQAKVDEVLTGAAGPMDATTATQAVQEPVAEAPKARGRSRKQTENKPDATKPSTQNVGDELEPPAFLDRRPEATTEPAATSTVSTATPTLEELREHLSKLLAAKGSNPKVVFDLIGKYKQADGTACAKASQVADGDRAALIVDITAVLKAEEAATKKAGM